MKMHKVYTAGSFSGMTSPRKSLLRGLASLLTAAACFALAAHPAAGVR
jgi:hypothetical protein